MTLQLTKKHDFDIVYDAQKIFRLILEAMSNPGRIVSIKKYADKLYGDDAALLAVAMTLLDNEVSFCACKNYTLSDEIRTLTLAREEQAETADFIFACEPENIIERVKCGTLADPHKSATVIIRNDGSSDCMLKLYGPGINGHKAVQVTRTVRDALILRDMQNYEYPQGIDLIFVSSAGELLAVPRLTRILKEAD